MARTSSKIVKSIPNTENGVGTSCTTESGDKYLITQNPLKGEFTLWKCLNDGFERISTSDSPLDFDNIIPWRK